MVARISAIDELVAKLNGASPSVCELYTEKVGELEKRKRSKLEAAEYRYTSSKDSIETGFNSSISSYNRSEKVIVLFRCFYSRWSWESRRRCFLQNSKRRDKLRSCTVINKNHSPL